ncbi:hypothetical protein GGI02_004565 [Coemansia sp. RSA 2322]|nr:hypothetical protein GGI02_004565 [Coemansia sp. RSA 2322]
MLATIAANVILSSSTTVSTEQQRSQFFQLVTRSYEAVCTALARREFRWERLLLHYSFMEVASRMDGTERWLETSMDPLHVSKNILDSDKREEAGSSGGPRMEAMGMVVVFQTAAHWTVFSSSASAGIIPQAAGQRTLKDVEEANGVVKQMVSSVFARAEGLLGTAEETASSDAGGWGAWDGQAHSISAANGKRARWQLLTDWLELACEYADSSGIEGIAARIISELSCPGPGARAQSLVNAAGFIEMTRLRDALGDGLAGFAANALRQQLKKHSSAVGCGALDMLEWLAAEASSSSSSFVGCSEDKDHRRKRRSKKRLVSGMLDALMERLGGGGDIGGHGVVCSDQASMWQQLVRGLSCFPPEYWGAEHAHVVLAVGLTADMGIARMCERREDATLLRVHSRALTERVLQCIAGGGSTSGASGAAAAVVGLVQHAAGLVEHWAQTASATEEEEDGEERGRLLLESTRRLVRLAVGAQAQAAFGQGMEAASTACRELCTGLYGRRGASEAARQLGLDSLGAVARAAALYAHKQQGGSGSGSGWDAWRALAASWLERAAQQVHVGIDALAEEGTQQLSTWELADYAALWRLHASLAPAGLAPSPGPESARGLDVARRVARALPQIQTSRQPSFALGLVALLIHQHGALAGGDDVSGPVLAFLARHVTVAGDDAALQALAGALLDDGGKSSGSAFAVRVGVEPLLRQLGAAAFGGALDAVLVRVGAGRVAAAAGCVVVQAFVRAAFRHHGGADGDGRRKAVQRRVGAILTAAAEAIGRTPDAVLPALRVASDLVLERALHLRAFDVAEALALVAAAAAAPASATAACAAPALFRAACRVLGALVRHHAAHVLRSAAVLVALLRALLHAFVARGGSAPPPDAARTPWPAAHAPLPAPCADALARVLAELAACRRPARKTRAAAAAAATDAPIVSHARGSSAAAAAAQVRAFAPFVLAEYCVIQGGGRHVARRAPGPDAASAAFQGLAWRPVPVPDLATSDPIASPAESPIIAAPLLRDALLPGLHALLDVMPSGDRAALLALLAADPADARHARPSVFGPARYAAAPEILKALYQSYVESFRYGGQV